MWLHSNKKLVILAPMDGITDSPFRQMVKAIAPSCIVFTEFLSARDLSKGALRTWLKFDPIESPLIVQLYGKDADDFKISAAIAEQEGAAGIDINMGCPSKKVVAHAHGSALMKDIDLSCQIIEEVKSNVKIPVTVKTRLGWDHHGDLIQFIKKLEDVGLDGVTIHGRTYAQKFLGEANWHPIYELKKNLSIPVFGNGDIVTPELALNRVGNLDGVMIGRGAIENPWLIQDICDLFEKGSCAQESLRPLAVQMPFWLLFLRKTSEIRGEIPSCHRFRKFLLNLIKTFNLSSEIRQKAIRVESIADVQTLFEKMIASQPLSDEEIASEKGS